LGPVDLSAAGAAHELGDLELGQTGEVQAHDIVRAAQVGQRVGELGRHVRLGVSERRQDQNSRFGGRPSQVTQQDQRRVVGPVPIFDHEQQRLAPPGARKDVAHRRVQAMALGIRIRAERRRKVGDARGQVGEQPRQLAAGTPEIVAQHVGVGGPDEMVERLDKRTVGRLDHGVAGAVEHQHPLRGHRSGKLSHQATLSRPRLAADQRQPTPLSGGVRNERMEGSELCPSADERRGPGQAQRAGKCLHGSNSRNSQI
jgi:hypothetical protein